MPRAKFLEHLFMDGLVKESNLRLIVLLKPEIAVTHHSLAGHTLDAFLLDNRIRAGRLAVVPSEIVPLGNADRQSLDGFFHMQYLVGYLNSTITPFMPCLIDDILRDKKRHTGTPCNRFLQSFCIE